jgi:hypothetical protein
MNLPSTFLFAQPSFVEGMGRLLDFAGTLNEYNRSANPDAIALGADWFAIGDDLRRAMLAYHPGDRDNERRKAA